MTLVGAVDHYQHCALRCLPQLPSTVAISDRSWRVHCIASALLEWSIPMSCSFTFYQYPIQFGILSGLSLFGSMTFQCCCNMHQSCGWPFVEDPVKRYFNQHAHFSTYKPWVKALVASGILLLDGGLIYLSLDETTAPLLIGSLVAGGIVGSLMGKIVEYYSCGETYRRVHQQSRTYGTLGGES